MIASPHSRSPTLLIVDDHPGFRSFARFMLAAEGFEVAGEAADGKSALDLARAQHPDVVLLDVQLPGIDGFEVARKLARCSHPPRVVLTSSRERSDYGSRVEQAPVEAFLTKRKLSGEALLNALAA
jgi:two-component system, NarL family, nitrate/nitrite response regulator NarL